ncbi:MAG: spherulation-specific family 4 protein, partial [Nitrososphaerales archaeon]
AGSAVESDVSSYASWYAPNGIFFDEMASSGSVSYYQALKTYAASLGFEVTVGNPGTAIASDLHGIFSFLNEYEDFGMPSSVPQGSSYIAHDVPTLPAADAVFAGAASYVYITDGPGGDHAGAYASLPTYFAAEIAELVPGAAHTDAIDAEGAVSLNHPG